MATTIKYPTSTNAVQKTLDAQLLSGATASMTLNSVTGIQNKEGVCVIDAVDANGTATPAKREYIKFTGVSGSTLTGLTRNADGGSSDQDHAVGAIVQFGPDVLQQQAIIDSHLTEHNEDGTHKSATVTTLKATGAEINTGTEDAKIVTPKALADSDYAKTTDITVTEDSTNTLTNKTLTSPKINENVALTSTATELNALDGQTGAWTAFTPSWTNLVVGTGGSASNTGQYCQIGKIVHFRVNVTLGTSGASVGTGPVLAPPVAIKAATFAPVGQCAYIATGTIVWVGYIDGYFTLRSFTISTYPTLASMAANVPFTWTAGNQISIYGTYEAA